LIWREVDAGAGEALELKRIRNIVDVDARKRHGDRDGEPSWAVIADCVLAHVSQHRQAREILDVPEGFTLDQYASMLGAEAEQANEIVEVRQVLEAMLGRTSDPARSTSQLAREVVAQAERWRLDAEHYPERLTWSPRFNNGNGGAIISLGGRTVLVSGEMADDLAEALHPQRGQVADLKAKVNNLVHERNEARDEVARLTAQAERWQSMCDDCIQAALETEASATKATASSRGVFCSGMQPASVTVTAMASRQVLEEMLETEAERQVRRCAEALGYIGEPNTLAIAVGDACLAFAKDLREINGRYMITVKRLEGDVEARDTIIEKWKAGSEWLQGELNNLVHERNEARAEVAKLAAQAESGDLQQRELSRQFMEYSQLVDGYKLAMVKLGSATQIAEALNWALGKPHADSEAPATDANHMVARTVLFSTLGAASISSFRVPTAATHLLDSMASVYGDRDAISLVELIDAAFAFGICASRHPEFREIRCPAGHVLDSEAPATATVLRHELTAKLRAAAKTATAWEEAAVREWAPLAPDYHGGDGTVTKEIEGPYMEHRLVMAWRGKIQKMADNLDPSEKAGQ
jgi:hypothetical protein